MLFGALQEIEVEGCVKQFKKYDWRSFQSLSLLTIVAIFNDFRLLSYICLST